MSYSLTLAFTLALCFGAQTLALRAVGGRTIKSESNFYSSVARIQTGIRDQPEIMLLGSSITGRLPDRTYGFAGVANLGCDGSSAVDALRAMDDGRLPLAPLLFIEGNTLYRATGSAKSQIAGTIGSLWFRLGEHISNLSATARPTAFLYSRLLAGRIGEIRGAKGASHASFTTKPEIPNGQLPVLSKTEFRLIDELAVLIGRLKKRGSAAVITVLPPGGATDSALVRLPTALAIRGNLPFLNLTACIPSQEIRYTDGVHMDPKSAALVVNTLLENTPWR